MEPETPTPHPPMTVEEKARVKRLSATEIELIDDSLAKHVTERFRKAAMIIGLAMDDNHRVIGIPDLYYFERLKLLVDRGLIELIGYSANMRFCEVRLKPVATIQNKIS